MCAELEGCWAEASDALLLFPLTEPVRRALLQLMHTTSAAASAQVRFRKLSSARRNVCPVLRHQQ